MPTTDTSPVHIPMTTGPQQDRPFHENLFRDVLLENTPDGVIFVDAQRKILAWNQTMEKLTGLSAKKVTSFALEPSLLGLTDGFGSAISPKHDPLDECLRTGKTKTGDYKLTGRSGREIKVEMKFSPVIASDGKCQGAVVLVHDSSIQLDLQRQLKDLYEFSMLDPLTQVANRAEFERAIDEFVRARDRSDFECSLIICDIDFFKQINDNYNHHIGDKALVAFAELLKQFVRSQDVVARYGGEEFVILCANCDQASAVERAEEIRTTLRKTPQPMLDGKYITASFGVSQLRERDTATDFFVRADTALLKAKELGRNRVIAAESKNPESDPEDAAENSLIEGVTWRKIQGQTMSSHQFRTRTPIPVLVEKLRGYIIEMDAEIRRVESNYACMLVECEDPEDYTRKGRFEIEIDFQEMGEGDESDQFGRRKYTYLRVTIREGRRRWFSTNATDLAPIVLSELRRYFMISDDSSELARIEPATEDKPR
ncbi:MAG: diguanylate cyclase [Planctomycetota bacterium]